MVFCQKNGLGSDGGISTLEISVKCQAAGSVPRCLAWRWCCCFARHQAKTPLPSRTTTTIIPSWWSTPITGALRSLVSLLPRANISKTPAQWRPHPEKLRQLSTQHGTRPMSLSSIQRPYLFLRYPALGKGCLNYRLHATVNTRKFGADTSSDRSPWVSNLSQVRAKRNRKGQNRLRGL